MSRAQASFDYLVVIGIAMTLLIPTFYLFYVHSQEASVQISSSRIDRIGNEVAKQAKTIYYTGRYAKTTIEFDVPDTLQDFRLGNNSQFTEMIMIVNAPPNNHSLVYFTEVPLRFGNCTHDFEPGGLFYNPGKKKLVIESCGDEVVLRTPQ